MIGLIGLGGCAALVVVVNVLLPDELLNVDFRNGADPFEVGETASGTFELLTDTYRIEGHDTAGPTTSVGDFERVAHAVGIRVELAEGLEAGTGVGVMCLGSNAQDALVGYGFFIDGEGQYILGRRDPSGRIEFLEQSQDLRINDIQRVSIRCVPDLDGDVAVTGWANGLEVVDLVESDGYVEYAYAGIAVLPGRAGDEVRFASVWARVPDAEWQP
jgi:hypothetical protein